MLDGLFGSKTAAQVLTYLGKNGAGCAHAMALSFSTSLNMVQKQLSRLEKGQILRSRFEGKKKLYSLNPLWPYYRVLRGLLRFDGRLVAEQALDPMDGRHLSLEERVALGDSLFNEACRLSSCRPYRPFAKSFDSFKDYEKWRKKQSHPWLV